MRSLFRLRRSDLESATFCDACSEVCTPTCRAATRFDRLRTGALYFTVPR